MLELALVFHNHQPLGQFERVTDEAVRLAYEPFVRLVEEHPALRVILHYSGPLLLELAARHRPLVDRIAALAAARRVELLASGIGEPILPALPARDRAPQVARMVALVEETFGVTPVGAWVTERVWDPALARAYRDAGIRYALLDEEHLRRAGVPRGAPAGPWRAVADDGALDLFASDTALRHDMPFRPVESVLDALVRRRRAASGADLVVAADDGEKFGEWPGTHELCYGAPGRRGWLPEFFAGLETLSGECRTVLLADACDRAPLGTVCVPPSAYQEMNEWAAGPAAPAGPPPQDPEARMGRQAALWHNFPRRYREAGLLHAKMHAVSAEVARIPDPHFRARCLADLHLAQCNCAYWHGVFGGIYLPHLRQALAGRLISARKTVEYYFAAFLAEAARERPGYAAKKHLDWIRAGYFRDHYESADLADALYNYGPDRLLAGRVVDPPPALARADFDYDGEEELSLRGAAADLYLDPAEGGALFSFDIKSLNFDLMLAMSRYPEAYHRDFAGQAGEPPRPARLVADPFRRASFRDRFLAAPTLDDLARGRFTEAGDFADAPYRVIDSGPAAVTLHRAGHVAGPDGPVPLSVTKRFALEGTTVEAEFTVECDRPPAGLFHAPSVHLALLSHEHDRRVRRGADARSLAVPHRFDGDGPLTAEDGWLNLAATLHAPGAAAMLHLPVYSISRNFDRFEEIYQGSELVPLLPLSPGESRRTLRLAVDAPAAAGEGAA